MHKPSLCLTMIVKNEAHVIRRCLDSVLPYVDHWVIVDTGSTDGTQDIVREHMRGVPGELYERPWRDFGSNRTEAFQLARGKSRYAFVMDADNVFHVPPGFDFDALDADGYLVQHRYAGTEFGCGTLFADRIPWRYEGVLHEYATADVPHQLVNLVGPWMEVHHEGARSRDPDTYRRDAAILEAALEREPGNARYAFYLAQSLKDAGEFERAYEAFMRRAAMPGWDEESWHARYQAAQMLERLARSPAEIQRAYLEAYNARPTRAEPLARLARWHRERKEWGLAFIFARIAAALPLPPDLLFVEEAVYHWQALDELAISAWYATFRDEGKLAVKKLLDERKFPPSEAARIEKNREYYGM